MYLEQILDSARRAVSFSKTHFLEALAPSQTTGKLLTQNKSWPYSHLLYQSHAEVAFSLKKEKKKKRF